MSNHINISSYEDTIAALQTFGGEVTEVTGVLNNAVAALLQTMQDDQPSMAIAEKVYKYAQALDKIVEYSGLIATAMQNDVDEAIEYENYMKSLAGED